MYTLINHIENQLRERLRQRVTDDFRNMISKHLSFKEINELIPNRPGWTVDTIIQEVQYDDGRKIRDAIVNKLLPDLMSETSQLFWKHLDNMPDIGSIRKDVGAISTNLTQTIAQLSAYVDKNDLRNEEIERRADIFSNELARVIKQVNDMQKQINQLKKE